MRKQTADHAHQIFGHLGLGYESVRTGGQGFDASGLAVVKGQQDHERRPGLRFYPSSGLEAVHVWHGNVHQHHVGVEAFDLRQSLAAGSGYPGQFECRITGEPRGDTLEKVGVVVDQEHSSRFHAALPPKLPIAAATLAELAAYGFLAALVAAPLPAALTLGALLLQAIGLAAIHRIVQVRRA